MCRAIKDVDLDIRRTTGTNLKNQNGTVIYTPPEGEDVLRAKMADWERFIHDDSDLDPLIKMAVAHYQFEAIHPFPDGNGRTGRILNILFLIEKELLDLPILYLSRSINDRRRDYYRLLLDVTTEQAWEPWVLYMLQAVDEMATWTRRQDLGDQAFDGAKRSDMCRSPCRKSTSASLSSFCSSNPMCGSAIWWRPGSAHARPRQDISIS